MDFNNCYRTGGCGPYEMYSCSECPASKPEYTKRYIIIPTSKKPIKIVFENSWSICDTDNPYEIEISRPLTEKEKQDFIDFIMAIPPGERNNGKDK